MTSPAPDITTLGDLKASGYAPRNLRAEILEHLQAGLRSGTPLFPGILGYEDTVVPAVQNALLCGHDLIFLGERGQAKSRMIRALTGLLDPWVPVIRGSEVNDDPFSPISAHGRALLAEMGDDTPIAWRAAADRYAEKLATPDVSVADLIGDVDPIKVAEGRHLSDEYTIHFTFTTDAHITEKNAKRKAALKKVADWVKQKPDNCTVVFREPDAEALSIFVDLLDPLYE